MTIKTIPRTRTPNQRSFQPFRAVASPVPSNSHRASANIRPFSSATELLSQIETLAAKCDNFANVAVSSSGEMNFDVFGKAAPVSLRQPRQSHEFRASFDGPFSKEAVAGFIKANFGILTFLVFSGLPSSGTSAGLQFNIDFSTGKMTLR